MKDAHKIKRQKRQQRAKRIRAKIFGVASRPRLAIFRSNKHIYAQLINDEKGVTLISASDLEIKKSFGSEVVNKAKAVGELIAQKAARVKIGEVVFDKRGYKYHGAVKALAEGARQAGLKF